MTENTSVLKCSYHSFFSLKKYRSIVLNADEVHLWLFYIPKQKENINYFFSLLTKDEKDRTNQYRFNKQNEEFLITRGALRQLLAMYLQKKPESIELNYNQWGKPFLPDKSALHFNVSHSGDYALLAFTRSGEVGIDIEIMKKDLEFEGIVETIFSDMELFLWDSLTSDKKVDYFYNVWVAREAFLKALGKGWLEDNKRIRNLSLFLEMSEEYGQVYENAYGTLEFLQTVNGYKSAYFVKGLPVKPILINFDNHTV